MIKVEAFFDKATFTLSYIVSSGKDAVVIDPVWDYDQNSSRLTSHSVDLLTNYLQENNLELHYILETHAHADHISGAQVLKSKFPKAKVAIGEQIKIVQKRFSSLYGFSSFKADGHQFDILLNEKEDLTAGGLSIKTISTPGHTPACCSFLIGENLFTGDALFMPDFGTGRCDFPDGSAEDLYDSVANKIYKLDPSVTTYTGHDYMPGGRKLRFSCSIKEQRETNIHLKENTSKEEYVSFRTGRDANLSEPKLLLPSLQININAGKLPTPEANGQSYLKIPIRS
jgi:glyoxylase-like metal-dependent hydrolase (beta-lactamase superfamily II)